MMGSLTKHMFFHTRTDEHMIFRHLTGFLLKQHGRISKGALGRSSSTSLREDRRERSIVVTLDPNKFGERNQQRLDIGDLQNFRPYIVLHNQSSLQIPLICPRLLYDMASISGKKTLLYYPPDTKAFLYYFTSPEKPRIAGELRLRVASSDHHTSFQSGSDLLKPNGQLWTRPLHIVSNCYASLYERLREDQLIPDDLDAALSSLPRVSPRYRRRHLLYTLNDTFIIDFSSRRFICVITEKGVETLPLNGPLVEGRTPKLASPYTGSALARFERSTHPDHKGTRTVVLRFLKIIEPVECVIPSYDGHIVPPKEGELHRRTDIKNKLDPQVWSVNIDKKGVMSRGLQLLWDA